MPRRLELSALALALACGAAAPSPAPTAAPSIPLTVRETAGVARRGEVLRSGIPLPRALGVRDPARLAVVGPEGRAVPAEFEVLARWGGGRGDAAAPIEWLLVSFPASVDAGKSAVYRLVTDGSAGPNPAPAAPLKLTRQGNRFTVDTGAAVFRFGGDNGALFDEVRLADGARLIGGGRMTARPGKPAGAAAAPVAHDALRGVRIERQGPLSAVVVVEGAYGMPPIGGGGLGSLRRYVFTAGSPTAIVRQAVDWEGSLSGGCNGCLAVKGAPNGVLLTGLRDELSLELGPAAAAAAAADRPAGGLQVQAVGPRKGAGLAGAVAAGEEAYVRQRLRANRGAPLACDVRVGARTAPCQKADGGVLAASGPRGTVAIALNHMQRYEPQALRLLPGGSLAVDLADDKVWLAHHQGLFATLAVAALPAQPASAPKDRSAAGRADLDRLVWAPLDHPLHAWPEAGWFAASQAVLELPVGALPRGLRDYDRVVGGALKATLEHVDSEGLAGLMTFGVFPRYWGQWGSPEIRCGTHDPTPGEAWDDLFWCGTWTDYHNTLATAPLWAMRTGEVDWLDDLAFPGALRTLHTQIMQCAPGDRWFYCGQAPSGYGAYRADFNSSHAYFDNLFLYYWLTGDSTVVETLRRGAETMRRHMCDLRGPERGHPGDGPAGPACPPDRPSQQASFVGRVASEWLAVFRFLGLASPDPSFAEDFRSGLARAVTQEYAEPRRGGRSYGFLGKLGPEPASMETEQMWLAGLYDAENLYRYQLDSGDAPIGSPPLAPSRVIAALARTVVDIEPHAMGGHGQLPRAGRFDVRGDWPLQLEVAWSGGRLGGELVSVTPSTTASERKLYGPEKACFAALLVRAGRQTGDRELVDAGRAVVELTLDAAGREILPLGKLNGEYLSRLHGAVALLAGEKDVGRHP